MDRASVKPVHVVSRCLCCRTVLMNVVVSEDAADALARAWSVDNIECPGCEAPAVLCMNLDVDTLRFAAK